MKLDVHVCGKTVAKLYLLSIIREEFGPLLDGTDLSLLAVVGGMGIGRSGLLGEPRPL